MTPSKPARKRAKKTGVRINVELPTELHRELRMRSVAEGLSLAEAISAAVGGWLKPARRR